MASGPFSRRGNIRLEFNMGQRSQSVANNDSWVAGELWVVNTSGYSYFGDLTWSINVDGQTRSGSSSYNIGPNGRLRLWADGFAVAHNADGTKSLNYSASSSGADLGNASASDGLTLTQIARASTASFSPSEHTLQPGVAVTINTNRASTTFDHSIGWNWRGLSGPIQGGVLDSVSWTPPWDFLNNIPDDTTAVGFIDVGTWQNGKLIGQTTSPFRVNVPASVVPTISQIAVSDDNPTVASEIGAFVQGESILKVNITAAGAYGSTVRARQFTIDGQTAASGATASLPHSGTRAVGAAATDSRGRTGTSSANLTVLPYAPPSVDGTVRRATSAGVPDEDAGAFLRVDLTAASRSLKPGTTEKNTLTIRVWTRERGAAAWTARNVISPSGLTYGSSFLISGGGIFDITKAYDVRITVSDKLRTNTWEKTVATADILMDWTPGGVGVKKYRERGALDVGGDTYTAGDFYAGPALTPIGPIGAGMEWYGDTLPGPGWAWQDGTAISRTQYAALFAVLGIRHGAGNGSTTFNLPNRNGRVGVGFDASQTEFNAVGKTGGSKTHTLSRGETAGVSLGVGSGYLLDANNAAAGTGQVGAVDSAATPHNNLQPYTTVRYIIRIA